MAWAVRSSLSPLGSSTALPFIFFFPAIAISAWYGRLGPAMLAIVLSALTADWFFIRPVHSLQVASNYDRVALAVFVLASLLIAFPIQLMHRARARMRAREEQLENLIDSTPFMLNRCSRDLRYTFVSRAYAEMLGRRPEDIAGKAIVDIMGQEGFNTILPHVEKVLRGERVEYESAVHFQGVGPRSLRVIYTPDKDKQGEVKGWIASILDVTAQSKAEQALREAHEKLANHAIDLDRQVKARTANLQEALSELEAFSYTVAHDLRAPLRAMQGYADTLLEEAPPALNPESLDYVRRIQRAATRLDRLTKEVLAYSQLSRQPMTLQAVNVDKLIREIVDHYPELSARSGCIEVRSPLLAVIGHESLLTQVISNLLVNACKFVKPGITPKVAVRTESIQAPAADGGPRVRISIEDNGIGIAPEHRDRLFQMFGRIHPVEKYEGTGIGLAIVKKAMARMDGSVGFESEPGKGSRFWIELPSASPSV